MQYSERRGGGIGGFIGFLAGVGIGILFASKPGKETRQQLVDFFNKSREKGGHLLRRGREQVEQAKETMTSEGGREPYYESGKYT